MQAGRNKLKDARNASNSFAIFTEADDLAQLHERAREAVRCHFDEGKAPKLIRLHYVRDESTRRPESESRIWSMEALLLRTV